MYGVTSCDTHESIEVARLEESGVSGRREVRSKDSNEVGLSPLVVSATPPESGQLPPILWQPLAG
jgi:hypothetical protein